MDAIRYYETELKIQKANLELYTEFGYDDKLEGLVKYHERNVKELEGMIENMKANCKQK